ncbi:hypothetical protein LXL04_020473 [Taraxacum kok-saghyz]
MDIIVDADGYNGTEQIFGVQVEGIQSPSKCFEFLVYCIDWDRICKENQIFLIFFVCEFGPKLDIIKRFKRKGLHLEYTLIGKRFKTFEIVWFPYNFLCRFGPILDFILGKRICTVVFDEMALGSKEESRYILYSKSGMVDSTHVLSNETIKRKYVVNAKDETNRPFDKKLLVVRFLETKPFVE